MSNSEVGQWTYWFLFFMLYLKILTSRWFASMQYTPILKQCEKIQVKCNFDNYYSFNSESDTENKKTISKNIWSISNISTSIKVAICFEKYGLSIYVHRKKNDGYHVFDKILKNSNFSKVSENRPSKKILCDKERVIEVLKNANNCYICIKNYEQSYISVKDHYHVTC